MSVYINVRIIVQLGSSVFQDCAILKQLILILDVDLQGSVRKELTVVQMSVFHIHQIYKFVEFKARIQLSNAQIQGLMNRHVQLYITHFLFLLSLGFVELDQMAQE
jgi:hypothetical protein